MKILKIIRCLFRGGHHFSFRNNLHGDRAMAMGARSVWACTKCPAVEYRKEVHEEPKVQEPWFAPEKLSDDFQRESGPCCHICCARKGQPHTPECSERGVVGE